VANPICPRCHGAFAVAALLARVAGYLPETDSAAASCPLCNASLEFRVRPGALELGYTYRAGSLHFESVASVATPRLRRLESDGAVSFLHDGMVFRVPGEGGD
jgi:hypothetical protein